MLQRVVAIFYLPMAMPETLRIQKQIRQEEMVVLALGAIPTVTAEFRSFQYMTYPCPDGVEIMPELRTWGLLFLSSIKTG